MLVLLFLTVLLLKKWVLVIFILDFGGKIAVKN